MSTKSARAKDAAKQYAIKTSRGTYFRGLSAIGPMMGGNEKTAVRFDSERAAYGVMAGHSFAFGDCDVVEIDAVAP